MFHLRMNQVVGFYKQNVWKIPVEEWHAGRSLASLLKMSLFHKYISNILLVKTNSLVYP